MDPYSTLPWVTWEAVNSYGGDTLLRVMTGSTQAKVEGMVQKAVWNWGSDSSVVSDLLGEPDRTTLYVGLPSVWVEIWCLYVFPTYVGGLLNWGL